ncbi:hypothetical protein [Streptomyces sp. NBC_01579]|uniref:hypothetical protein n=1 Tax=unclassified Streptomyces TaxID=2593676 RepID=UPI00386E4BE5|nr:hypothetical protein OHB03_38190 [Streptomyces sp. NBC_01643]
MASHVIGCGQVRRRACTGAWGTTPSALAEFSSSCATAGGAARMEDVVPLFEVIHDASHPYVRDPWLNT